jgi:hypothetical protein
MVTHNNGAALIACVWVLRKAQGRGNSKNVSMASTLRSHAARTSTRRAKSTPHAGQARGGLARKSALGGFKQPLHLILGQVLSGPWLVVGEPPRRTVRFTMAGVTSLRYDFAMRLALPALMTVRTATFLRTVSLMARRATASTVCSVMRS